jgi:site-specific DNA-cytosine methylase
MDAEATPLSVAADAAAREAKRLASQRKRDADRAELDRHAEVMRKLRARKAAEAAAAEEAGGPLPPLPRRVFRMAEFAAGLAGALVAVAALAQQPCFSNVDFCSAFACDYEPSKIKLYNAAAAVVTPPSPPAELADVTDAAYFTAARVASWGSLDLIVSSIPCTSLSSLGKRDGLKSKTVSAFIVGLLRILSLALAPVVVLECTRGLGSDKRLKKALLDPLSAMGYSSTWTTLDARHWVGAVRLRLYMVCFRSEQAFKAFAFPSPPPAREIKLYNCILPAFDPRASARAGAMAPPSSYAMTPVQKKKLASAVLAAHRAGRKGSITEAQRAKAAKVCEKELSIAARAVAKLPLVRGRTTSRVVTFHFNRVTQIERTYGVAPTLTKSGAYLLRDAFGVRSMTGAEVAKLHGYPPRVIAAYEAVASSGQIVAAVGDGFVINVVRDVIKAAVRAAAGMA